MTHYMLAAKDFSSRTLKALAQRGLFVTGCQSVSTDGAQVLALATT